MANPASVANQNILPVQAYFNVDGSFNTFIGQGQPFTVPGSSGLTILDVPNLNATIYPTFSVLNSGSISALDVASTKVTFNPYTGIFAAPTFQGALTGTASSATNLSGGSAFSIVYQSSSGTTAYLPNGTTGQVLTATTGGAPVWGASSGGGAVITDDTTTNATRYLGFTSATTGSLSTLYTSSTKLQYNPSTGQLTATSYAGTWAGTALTNGQLANSSITINGSAISLGGSVSVGTVTSVTGTAPVVSSGGATPAISMAAASASTNGYLTSTDWNTFNNKGSGTVTSVSVASANGFAGTSSGGATPALTLTTSVTGLLKGNGTAMSAATAGTDYVAPATATTFTATQTFNGSSSLLAAVFPNIAETATVSATAATGTINYYLNSQSVLYYTTSASANWTVNFAFSSGTSLNTALSTGQSMTAVFLVTQGSTAYYNSAVTIDGTSVTPKWQGGSAPTAGNASGVDVYSYTIIKTGSAAYTVLASITQFK